MILQIGKQAPRHLYRYLGNGFGRQQHEEGGVLGCCAGSAICSQQESNRAATHTLRPRAQQAEVGAAQLGAGSGHTHLLQGMHHLWSTWQR